MVALSLLGQHATSAELFQKITLATGEILNLKSIPNPPLNSKNYSMNSPKIPIGHVLQVPLVKMSIEWKE